MPSDWDDNDRPRRRRSRRQRGPSVGLWVLVAGLAVLAVTVGAVGAVVSRMLERSGVAGTAAPQRTTDPDDLRRSVGSSGLSTIIPSSREITAAEFQAIKQGDTLASLEARFGPARRLGTAELDNLYLNMVNRGHDARLKISFGKRLRDTYNQVNPECYLWSGGNTKVYLIPAQGHPTAVWHLKWYYREGTNARGEFHGETIHEDFLNLEPGRR